jgi:hypothetical protein
VKWLLNTVYAPSSVTEGETFLWHNVDSRLQLGVAFLWKQEAFRGLANYELIEPGASGWNLRVGFGLQGISTGNPGYFATSEKSVSSPDADVSVYLGVGFRTNEDHGHLLGGFKITPKQGNLTFGAQMDGHDVNPFVTYRLAPGVTAGYYWIDTRTNGWMISIAR